MRVIYALNPQELSAAAKEFKTLRRRNWQFFIGGFIWFLIFFAPLIAISALHNTSLAAILAALLMTGGIVLWAGAMLTWIRLYNWRCPQCHERFTVTWFNTWPSSRCKHCGLDLRFQS